jgi:DNA invertase Pin-like site-specific DNA recombinase
MSAHSTNSLPIDAAAYYRMSDDRQENSIARQQSQVVPYAAAHNYRIVCTYTDLGISGSEITKRKDFQRMLRDAQTGAFQAILCDDKDRFGRFDSIDLGEVVAPLRRKGVWVDTVANGKVDWESFSGRITDAVLQEAKNLEQDAISRRVLTDALPLARAAVFTGGPVLYGFKLQPHPTRKFVYAPDGHKAEVVRWMFKRYAEGATARMIAQELHDRGVRSPRGGEWWNPNTILSLLTNRRYLGDWTWGVIASGKRNRHAGNGSVEKTARQGPRCVRRPQGDWIVTPESHEALVDRDLFEAVQARLKDNKGRSTPHQGGGNFVLSKLLVCGHCGAYLLGATCRGNRVYSCGGYLAYGKSYCNLHTVHEAAMVKVLLSRLQEAFLAPENLKVLRDAAREQARALASGDDKKRLEGLVASLKRKVEQGGARLLEIDHDLLPQAQQALHGLKAQLKTAEADLKAAMAARPVEDLEAEVAAVEAALWSLREAWTAADYTLLRNLMRETFTKVELWWDHQKTAKTTRSTLARGVIHLRPQERLNLFASACRFRCGIARLTT